MITSSSIQYISQVLSEPQHISEADKESIAALTQTYPYFVPARYMEAANQHKKEPYSGPMMSMMQLYMGNWLLYCQFLQSAMGSDQPIPAPPKAPVAPAPQPAIPEVPPAPSVIPIVESALAEALITDEPVVAANTLAHQETAELLTEIPEQKETIATPAEEEKQKETIPAEAPVAEVENIVTPVVVPEQVTPIAETPAPAEETKPVIAKQEETKEPVAAPKPKPLPEHPMPEIEAGDNESFILPIYTEDYFLHQGMHVSNNIPADLPGTHDEGKQLMVVMSFAEWLTFFKTRKEKEADEEEDKKAVKTMWQKEKLAAALEEENEEIPEKVFEMAVNSIAKEDDLVSESLAEIHAMQGRHDKAIEMYRKLSLRNPQKKAYFARKIEVILKDKQS